MYAVELDRSKRLLVISAAQKVTSEEAKMVAQRIGEVLQDVAPGFRVLADFRGLESMDSAAARHIAKIMDALAEKNVASVTRVMPDPRKDIGLNILSQFHYGPEVTITTFETLADAVQSIAAKADSPPSLMLRSLVSFLNCLSLGHVFSLFCSAVEMRAFLVVNMRFGVNPNLAVASARRGRFCCCLSVRSFRWGWRRGGGTGCCARGLRFEQIAEIKLAR